MPLSSLVDMCRKFIPSAGVLLHFAFMAHKQTLSHTSSDKHNFDLVKLRPNDSPTCFPKLDLQYMDQGGIKYPLASGRWEGRRLRLEGSAVEPAKHRWRTTWFLLKHLTWLASTRPKPKSFNCHIKFWHFWTPSKVHSSSHCTIVLIYTDSCIMYCTWHVSIGKVKPC